MSAGRPASLRDDAIVPTPAADIPRAARKKEWQRYYSRKRIHEQLLQVHMLAGLEVDSVLEIGPYYGLVTAMLDNAGYSVTTMDIVPPSFEKPAVPHRVMDLTAPDVETLRGFDCIMCCATLEHVHWPQAEAALRAFHAAQSRYVVISVPYQGTQLFWQLYANAHTLAQHFAFKKLRSRRAFAFDEAADPYGHKWEIGYKGYPLKRFETLLDAIGFRRIRRDFSYPSYAVFYALENPTAL